MTSFTLTSHQVTTVAPAVRAPVPARRQQPPRGSWAHARMAGRYDAAQTNDQNRAHWAAADSYGPDASHRPEVRRVIRNRARYEKQNNGYAKAGVRTKRNDVVGTGPRLQVTLPATWTDPDFGTEMTTPAGAARAVERAWRKWMRASGTARALRMMVEAGWTDGEVFGVFVTNPEIDDPVKVALRLLEAEQCATPDLNHADPLATDGIRFDQYGNPVEYHFLKAHPGEMTGRAFAWNDYDRVPAKYVVHWFDPDRPGQRRGVSALAPALGLYGQLRRYTGAVLSSAETVANHAMVIYTDQSPPTDDPIPGTEGEGTGSEVYDAFDRVPMPQNGVVTMPYQWKPEQIKAEQPTTTYPMFKGEVLTEAGAALNLPENVSTKSSAKYNYSSARLDHLPTRQDARICREDIRDFALDRLFRAWVYEATLTPGHLPAGLPPLALWEWSWQWDGWESLDPVKEATADDIGLKNGSRNLADVLADRGKDPEEHLRQRAKEIALAVRIAGEEGVPLGLLLPWAATAGGAAPSPAPPPEPNDGEDPLADPDEAAELDTALA